MASNTILVYFYIALTFVSIVLAQLIPIGTKQTYQIKNQVNIKEIRNTSYLTGYEFNTLLKVSSIWHTNEGETQLLHFELDPFNKIGTIISRNKNDIPQYKSQNIPDLGKLKHLEFYLYLSGGEIKEFFAHKDDKNAFSLNFKRGLGSIFQVQIKNHAQITHESDLLGICSVLYDFKSSTYFTKKKFSCRGWNLKVGRRYESAMDINLSSRQDIHYKLTQDFILRSVDATEIHDINVASKNDIGSKIESHIVIDHVASDISEQKLSDSHNDIIDKLKTFQSYDVEGDIDGQISKINSNLKTHLLAYQEEMNNLNIGKLSTAYIFAQLLPISRITKTNEFEKILKSKKMAENLDQIVDLMGATQTMDAHIAIMKVFQFENEDDFEIIERYLQALSIASRPEKSIFLDLYDILMLKYSDHDDSKLYDTLLQTLASIAHKYSFISPDMFEDSIIIKIKDYILHKLNTCQDFKCKSVYIRGLQNLKDPSTIPTLLEIALGQDNSASVQAMKALKTFNVKLFTKKDRNLFEKIFYQISQKFDSTARISALDILLSMKPSKTELTHLLEYVGSNDKAFEIKRYTIEKLNLLASKCPKFKLLFEDTLKNRPDLYNYNLLGQKGLSSVLERNLAVKPAFNESLLSAQEIFNGVLKQGDVDYLLKTEKGEISTFKLGLFTTGLSTFISNSEEEVEEESQEIKAGMEITIQNTHLRPLIFFNGHSELMGHVWSGTASEPTTAYKATVIQQDHEEYILLQNGITIYMQIVGAKSIDLNGKIEFSLWNRNAHTEIIKKSGEVILGSLTLGSSFIKIKNEFLTESNPKINVNADVDFYSDIKLCIQLEKPKSSLRHRIQNTLQILGEKKNEINVIKITTKLPGKTLALNQKNNEMCNMIG
ncbi:microsomal triacylglycerol transfer protein [Condylostylus longicornis]|uniref:microsomal triacylglycerol transfer protein n=1 Tax=Condylostylus longicornis TaxID=2530218 RepID=UPI00244DCD44|nr:microsomal triacylglycerol transfer protein [Condylostylus longicornis]